MFFFAARRTALATLLFMCVVTVIWSYFMNTLKKSGGFLKARVKGRGEDCNRLRSSIDPRGAHTLKKRTAIQVPCVPPDITYSG